MTRRMLDSGLWANERFGEMPMMARLLLLGIINHADDQGRIKGKLSYLRTEIFRYDEDVTNEQVAECLEHIEANGTITIYQEDGKDYIQLLNWWEYQSLQFAAPSAMPRPKHWRDRVRYNAKGGNTLTCNWITPKGEKPIDTCDEDGCPLPIIATLPPRNPGGRPPANGHGNPGGNPNKDQDHDQEQTKGRDRARMSTPTNLPPLVVPTETLPSEYIPGVKRPQQNQAKRNCDHYGAQAAQHGIGPEPFRLMVDSVLSATGKTALANTTGDIGQSTLNAAKETVCTLLEMNRRTLEDVQAVLVSWREDDYRGASPPTFAQIVEHGSAMAAGTHITKRGQSGSKKEFSSYQDYNDWARHHDPECKRIREGITIKGILVKRPDYRLQPVH